ncbi:RhuM family protein [Nocardia sp. IBHARD005]|uniref:RhuM family protein n=1 Tax=Nocardia sp. IBHARD005 TaxID=3457765 RepID=UPI0040589030
MVTTPAPLGAPHGPTQCGRSPVLNRTCQHSPVHIKQEESMTNSDEPNTHNAPAPVGVGDFIVYNTEDGRAEVQLRTVDGTVWLTQRQMADLFARDVRTINEHIKTIYDDGECVIGATIRKFRTVRVEGDREVTREIDHYNLDMILAVGYRVRSPRGVQFRRWATTVLREYLIKGFAMNDARLEDPQGLDYFDELLERIRDIRASEKRFYVKVRDVFAASSVDYNPKSKVAQTFFATIQNKLLYAVCGCTAVPRLQRTQRAAQRGQRFGRRSSLHLDREVREVRRCSPPDRGARNRPRRTGGDPVRDPATKPLIGLISGVEYFDAVKIEDPHPAGDVRHITQPPAPPARPIYRRAF